MMRFLKFFRLDAEQEFLVHQLTLYSLMSIGLIIIRVVSIAIRIYFQV